MRNIVNTCNIDTVYGNRTINLIREDIAETNDELIVFSTHALMDYPVDGEVYKALKKKYKVNYESKEEAVLNQSEEIVDGIIESVLEPPKKAVGLVVTNEELDALIPES